MLIGLIVKKRVGNSEHPPGTEKRSVRSMLSRGREDVQKQLGVFCADKRVTRGSIVVQDRQCTPLAQHSTPTAHRDSALSPRCVCMSHTVYFFILPSYLISQ